MTTYTAQLTVVRTLNNEEAEVVVDLTADVSPVIPGRFSGPPESCYPAEGGEVENLVATVGGLPFELTAEEEEEAASLLASKAE